MIWPDGLPQEWVTPVLVVVLVHAGLALVMGWLLGAWMTLRSERFEMKRKPR